MSLRKVKFLVNWSDRIGKEETYHNGYFYKWVDGEGYSPPFGLVEDESGKMHVTDCKSIEFIDKPVGENNSG